MPPEIDKLPPLFQIFNPKANSWGFLILEVGRIVSGIANPHQSGSGSKIPNSCRLSSGNQKNLHDIPNAVHHYMKSVLSLKLLSSAPFIQNNFGSHYSPSKDLAPLEK